MRIKVRRLIVLVILAATTVFLSSEVEATFQYAREAGKGCAFCHFDSNGGPLNNTGYAFIRNSYRYPLPKELVESETARPSASKNIFWLIIGYIHILASFMLIGAIFYIHLFIKPARFTGGLPKQERILGITCLSTILMTGIILTFSRIEYFGQFFESTFGIILFVKILLFLIMITNAVVVVFVLHRKMKKTPQSGQPDKTENNITARDGKEGRPAWIIHDGTVYDVTESKHWEDGTHYGRHSAGTDITEAMKGAPHGADILERVKKMGTPGAAGISISTPGHPRSEYPRRIFIIMAYANLVLILLILLCVGLWQWGFPIVEGKHVRKQIAMGKSENCLTCHMSLTPGIVHDWQKSMHAGLNVGCRKCHECTDSDSPLVNRAHLKNSPLPVSMVVTSKKCASCHPREYKQYARSKHANTREIMWKVDKWLQHGMNNSIERLSGCNACHGTVVKLKEGRPVKGTWPNVGVGRKNPDGSLGSCSSCHTRHAFSKTEARKPEACDQCHLGPDHPQIEIYNESKHGTIYHHEGDSWNWSPRDGKWTAGRDYRSPTCAACHMSGTGKLKTTHDVTERLAWETQAPLTIRPSEFKAFPSGTDWKKERDKMKQVCRQCHASSWTDAHFVNMDNVIENYNREYYEPVKKIIDTLYNSGKLSRTSYFDEDLEWEFYEFWHHEGRRARMGASMMAPDYAWWHGFYELKHRYLKIMKKSRALLNGGVEYRHLHFPGKIKK